MMRMRTANLLRLGWGRFNAGLVTGKRPLCCVVKAGVASGVQRYLSTGAGALAERKQQNDNARTTSDSVEAGTATRTCYSALHADPITPAEKLRFDRDGFIMRDRLLPMEIVEILRTRYEKLFKGDFETGVYPDEWHWRQGISKEEATREINNGWKCDRMVASVALSESIGALASQLMGWEEGARFGQDDILHKPPGGSEVYFHQDSAYISRQFNPSSNNSVTVWIALDDADEERGIVEYAPGSHKWKIDYEKLRTSAAEFHGESGDYREPLLRASRTRAVDGHSVAAAAPPFHVDSTVKLSVPAGGVIFHHQDVWHGSGRNSHKSLPRRALGLHLLRNGVQFHQRHYLHPSFSKPGGDDVAETPQSSSSGDRYTFSTYIYGRYQLLNSTQLAEEFFPVVYSPRGDRSKFLENYCTYHW